MPRTISMLHVAGAECPALVGCEALQQQQLMLPPLLLLSAGECDGN